jgi:hypothetical protein
MEPLPAKYPAGFYFLRIAWLVLILTGCAAASGGQSVKTDLFAEVITISRYCYPAPKEWTATWIRSEDAFRRMLSKCSATFIGEIHRQTPSVDFQRFGVLAVEMGEQRTAGYGFDRNAIRAFVVNKTAVVELVVNRPAPGAITAAMMTSPCILIRLPADAYRHIRIQDQTEQLLTRIDLP